MWSKLFALGVRGYVFNVTKALYTETTARIRTAYGMTHQFNQDAGVRQGCVLAPLLFILFILDFSFALDLCPKLGLSSTSINHRLYADDLVLFADSAKNLQLLLNKLGEYAVKNKFSINTRKSKIMTFGKHHRCHSDDFTLQDTVLEMQSKHLQVLGSNFCIVCKIDFT